MIDDIATLEVRRVSHWCSRKVTQRLCTTFILMTYLTIQTRHVCFIAIQLATKPRESLIVAFVLPLPLLKRSAHHLPLLAHRSIASSMERLRTDILSDQPNYWTAITCTGPDFCLMTDHYNWPCHLFATFCCCLWTNCKRVGVQSSCPFYHCIRLKGRDVETDRRHLSDMPSSSWISSQFGRVTVFTISFPSPAVRESLVWSPGSQLPAFFAHTIYIVQLIICYLPCVYAIINSVCVHVGWKCMLFLVLIYDYSSIIFILVLYVCVCNFRDNKNERS